MNANIFAPGPTLRTVRSAKGELRTVPDGWSLVLPGDAALTSRVKAAGEHWIVQEKKGRRVFSGAYGHLLRPLTGFGKN